MLSHISTFYTTKRPIVRKPFDTPCYRNNNVFPPLPYNARNRLDLYDARGMICVKLYSASVCSGLAPLLRFYSGTASAFRLTTASVPKKDITKDTLQSSIFFDRMKVEIRTDTACPVFSLICVCF